MCSIVFCGSSWWCSIVCKMLDIEELFAASIKIVLLFNPPCSVGKCARMQSCDSKEVTFSDPYSTAKSPVWNAGKSSSKVGILNVNCSLVVVCGVVCSTSFCMFFQVCYGFFAYLKHRRSDYL